MEIKYRDTKDFDVKDIERLFLSVKWDSGKYPGKLVRGMHNSSHVVSAWNEERLVGLVRALDDGETVAFVKIMPSDPKTRRFYEKYGFITYDNYFAMVIKNL